MSALLRTYVEGLKDYLVNQNKTLLQNLIIDTVNVLRNKKLNESDILEFISKSKKVSGILFKCKDDIKRFSSDGTKNDDQFALFQPAIDDFQAYVQVYIAIRTGNWRLRVVGMKSMALRFFRSGAV